ncbi:autoinducer binding domain-containing protein [Bradyrhizobium sp. 2TAF24]|uniref:autoinducer binding domain-containing protein n=1 Tax=Bradyrhizobium sp. 2TAF24 TaxID=3233011 RepID=UPI003F9045BA
MRRARSSWLDPGCSLTKALEHLLEEFADAIHTVEGESGFERVARRVAEQLGFRWFAYLDVASDRPTIVSPSPKTWTRHYCEHDYQRLDPVVRRAIASAHSSPSLRRRKVSAT